MIYYNNNLVIIQQSRQQFILIPTVEDIVRFFILNEHHRYFLPFPTFLCKNLQSNLSLSRFFLC
jgi:hypothetical protein